MPGGKSVLQYSLKAIKTYEEIISRCYGGIFAFIGQPIVKWQTGDMLKRNNLQQRSLAVSKPGMLLLPGHCEKIILNISYIVYFCGVALL